MVNVAFFVSVVEFFNWLVVVPLFAATTEAFGSTAELFVTFAAGLLSDKCALAGGASGLVVVASEANEAAEFFKFSGALVPPTARTALIENLYFGGKYYAFIVVT